MGKTALMVNMTEHAVLPDEGPPGAVLVFSLEQPADQVVPSVARRSATSVSSVPVIGLRPCEVDVRRVRRLVCEAPCRWMRAGYDP